MRYFPQWPQQRHCLRQLHHCASASRRFGLKEFTQETIQRRCHDDRSWTPIDPRPIKPSSDAVLAVAAMDFPAHFVQDDAHRW
jgi:hypothetical protein